jgi:tRNA pseudouridine55 synthase
MNGLLLVDKPVGITSFDVIRRLRRTTGVKKIGHAGTLDPQASGLMILLFGSACKSAGNYSKLDKAYRAEVTLGANSSTGDREGELVSVSNRVPGREEVEAALKKFTGIITQTPPAYSAIKIAGKEAYKYARQGKAVEVPSRQITIHRLNLLSYDYPKLEVEADVSSGTYIRTLAEDIGKELGTGAFLSGLTRTSVGGFKLDEAVSLESNSQQIARALISIDKT